jgi:hypothetical protein
LKDTTYADSISQDAITDAAIEQLAIDLYEGKLVGHFITSFMPNDLDSWLQDYGGVQVDNPDGLLPLLEDFHNNLHTVDMDTGISNPLVDGHAISATDTAAAYAERIAGKCFEILWDLRLNKRARTADNDEFINAIGSWEALASIEKWGQSGSTSSLQEQDEGIVLENLRLGVTGAKADASFCCGGSVAIKPFAANTVSVDLKAASPPVILHWDQPDGRPGRMVFGDEKMSSAEFQAEFQAHIRDMCSSCQVATFGRQGQDVYDATYREALKLEPSQFTTNFHPHDYGILDDLAQILLPSYLGGNRKDEDLLGVHAELYKLNVYSAPSGIFKSHVDTPRSSNQFGSLVVCLPASHEGGNLVIRHNSRVANYDWSSSKEIEWAAFYSDCEHEVLQVTQGHRITLTYNLTFVYARGLPPTISTHVYKTPLYNDLQAALEKPGFMAKGGILGFACNHSYAHSRNSQDRLNLPAGLKGVDMVIYATFAALGLCTAVRPVLNNSKVKKWFEDGTDDDDRYGEGKVFTDGTFGGIRERYSDTRTNKAREKLRQFQRLGRNPRPTFKPNEAAMRQVELTGSSMGLTHNACQRALRATGNDDPEVAIQWLLTHREDDNIDCPLDLDNQQREEVKGLDDLSSRDLILDYTDKAFDSKYRMEKIRDFRARLAHIKANRHIDGLGEPPSSDRVDHIGHRFHRTELPSTQVEELSDMKKVCPAPATRFVHLEPTMIMFWPVNVTAMLKLSWMLY